MFNNKGFASVTFIIILVIIIIGGYLLLREKLQKELPEQQVATSSNKLFEFFDTFTANRDMGTLRIEFMYPEEHLILLGYPTSQEMGAYAVYDYQKDFLYKNVGDSYYPNGGRFPQAFIGSDMLLMYNIEPEEVVGDFVIQDFNNNIIKTIMTNVSLHEIYPKYGKVITIDTNMKDEGRFVLDSETLELSQWKRYIYY